MEAEVRGILTAAANPAETEAGFGTFLADAFAGVGEITVADRAEFPEPVDLP
jgi:plasmid stability protein